MNSSSVKSQDRAAFLLTALCWLVYTASYVGRGNYAANINLVMDYYSVNHADAGLVSTAFFFAYGIGQVINGILCKKYNIRWVIFVCLMISGTINLIVPLLPSFAPVKYFWMINGFVLSALWPTLIRLLSERLSSEYMARATVFMGTTVAAGTFFVYGSSAALSLFTSFKASFYTSAAILLSVAVIWLFMMPRILPEDTVEIKSEIAEATPTGANKRTEGGIYAVICLLALFGIITNLIKDGLTTWVPAILKERYQLTDSLSIILTLALPIVSIFGNSLAGRMHKVIPDYVYKSAIMLFSSGAIIGVIICSFSADTPILTFIGFTLVALIASACNSLITSVFPLFMSGKLNSGLIALLLRWKHLKLLRPWLHSRRGRLDFGIRCPAYSSSYISRCNRSIRTA